MLIQEKKTKKLLNVKPQPKCRHVHISERTKTDGTPYIKGWCEKCKAWVYTEKRYCICCRKYVKHKTHYLRLKKILNVAMETHYQAIEDFKIMPHKGNVYVEVATDNKVFHIPLKLLVLYTEKVRPTDMLPQIQDSIRIVKINTKYTPLSPEDGRSLT
tara:strand:+ start:5117 stop:5590 length:474 start_codon:yes stop_codon:yes gene_type:complete